MSAVPSNVLIEELPLAQRLALTYAPKHVRPQWLALFALDVRLSRIVAKATEPMLAQMRLAWWRDQLHKPVADRPEGDVLLDLIGTAWSSRHEGALASLVDGWEHLLADGNLSGADAKGFVDGRATAIAALAARTQKSGGDDDAFAQARYWASVDLLTRLSSEEERTMVASMIDGFSANTPALPRTLRPLTLLGGLARRAQRNGELELLGSRASVLAGIRLGLLGR